MTRKWNRSWTRRTKRMVSRRSRTRHCRSSFHFSIPTAKGFFLLKIVVNLIWIVSVRPTWIISINHRINSPRFSSNWFFWSSSFSPVCRSTCIPCTRIASVSNTRSTLIPTDSVFYSWAFTFCPSTSYPVLIWRCTVNTLTVVPRGRRSDCSINRSLNPRHLLKRRNNRRLCRSVRIAFRRKRPTRRSSSITISVPMSPSPNNSLPLRRLTRIIRRVSTIVKSLRRAKEQHWTTVNPSDRSIKRRSPRSITHVIDICWRATLQPVRRVFSKQIRFPSPHWNRLNKSESFPRRWTCHHDPRSFQSHSIERRTRGRIRFPSRSIIEETHSTFARDTFDVQWKCTSKCFRRSDWSISGRCSVASLVDHLSSDIHSSVNIAHLSSTSSIALSSDHPSIAYHSSLLAQSEQISSQSSVIDNHHQWPCQCRTGLDTGSKFVSCHAVAHHGTTSSDFCLSEQEFSSDPTGVFPSGETVRLEETSQRSSSSRGLYRWRWRRKRFVEILDLWFEYSDLVEHGIAGSRPKRSFSNSVFLVVVVIDLLRGDSPECERDQSADPAWKQCVNTQFSPSSSCVQISIILSRYPLAWIF